MGTEAKTKRCSKCGEEKELEAFMKDSRRHDGRGSWCRACKCAGGRKLYAAKDEEWRKRERSRHRAACHAGKLVRSARCRAREKGIPFAIGKSDVEVPEVCPVLGISLHAGADTSRDCSPSLDRIIPELGYVPGNVIVVSNRANRWKSDMTVEDMERLLAFYKHLSADSQEATCST